MLNFVSMLLLKFCLLYNMYSCFIYIYYTCCQGSTCTLAMIWFMNLFPLPGFPSCTFCMLQMYLCSSRAAAFIPIHQKSVKCINWRASPVMKTPLKKSAVLHQAAPIDFKTVEMEGLSLIGDARGLIKQLWLSLKQTLGTTYLTSD